MKKRRTIPVKLEIFKKIMTGENMKKGSITITEGQTTRSKAMGAVGYRH
jgi:hypothetical protein